MFNQFQILKDNKDNTFDIEVVTYDRATITHPVDSQGQKLTGSSLMFAINKWILENYPINTGDVDQNAFEFITENGLDENFNINEVLPELNPNPSYTPPNT